MDCPRCGKRMNRHAEKVIEPRTPAEAARMDPALGGAIEEFHSCPHCGWNESRPGR
jgi:predicted RNA-binding Zn-ribbon protein involved in translation (DUF1610 family)